MSRRATLAQTRLILRIAQHGGELMVTNTGASKCYTLADGTPLNRRDAEGVLPHLIANKDGLFNFRPQSWRVRKPGDK
jgi:hypothetical protein